MFFIIEESNYIGRLQLNYLEKEVKLQSGDFRYFTGVYFRLQDAFNDLFDYLNDRDGGYDLIRSSNYKNAAFNIWLIDPKKKPLKYRDIYEKSVFKISGSMVKTLQDNRVFNYGGNLTKAEKKRIAFQNLPPVDLSYLDDLKREKMDLVYEQDQVNTLRENEQDIPEIIIAKNMPKIDPDSAEKETGGKAGTGGDLNIGLLKKGGASVEEASERIWMDHFNDNPSIDDYFIRNEIIEILKMGKKNYIDQFTNDERSSSIKQRLKYVDQQINKFSKKEFTELLKKSIKEINKLPKKKLSKSEKLKAKRQIIATTRSINVKDGQSTSETKKIVEMGRKLNALRSYYGMVRDSYSDNRKVLAPTKHNLTIWSKNPDRYDLIGVDTHKTTKATIRKKDQTLVDKILNWL
jgi:hypothetical protein